MAKKTGLYDIYIDALRDLYNAETQIVKALPRMAKAASNAELSAAFTEHADQSEGHIDRLEQVFGRLDMKVRGKKCIAMEGLIDEAKEIMSEDIDDNALDAALIAAAQKVEHYEMAAYGTVRTWAEQLGFDDQANLLQQTLNEEKDTDKRLTDLAESIINLEAESETSASSFGKVSSNGHSRTNGRSKR
jgi:ferritin-like metal-binding protein YciE